jgi:NTE family protein
MKEILTIQINLEHRVSLILKRKYIKIRIPRDATYGQLLIFIRNILKNSYNYSCNEGIYIFLNNSFVNMSMNIYQDYKEFADDNGVLHLFMYIENTFGSNLPEAIVMSGGGIKGAYYVGALKYFEENNILKNIKSYSAVSIGSLICFMILLGYKYKEIENILKTLDISSIIDIDVFKILDTYSIDSGDRINKFLLSIVKNKYNNERITFKELYDKTNVEFNVIATDINNNKEQVFNYKTFPRCSVVGAVRMSMNIPILWSKIKYKGIFYVDGGLSNNFPIELYEDIDKNKVLGMALVGKPKPNTINNIIDYATAIIKNTLNSRTSDKIDRYKNKGYSIIHYTSNLSSLDLEAIKPDKMLECVKEGYEATKAHFQ